MISVVTVVRNDLKGIRKTYESLVSQNYNNFQWVVVDALSTDGTLEFIKSIDDSRLKFISEKDKGIYDAMNKGIKLSTYEYIYFLNAGDFLYNKFVLSNIVDVLGNNNYDIVCGNVIMRLGQNAYTRSAKKDFDSVLDTMPGHHQATFYKTSLLKRYNYDLKYEFSGDYYIVAKLYREGFRNYFYAPLLISEFEVGHHSYKNLFKIWSYSNDIQKNILNISFHFRTISSIKRLFSSILIILFFQTSKYLKLKL